MQFNIHNTYNFIILSRAVSIKLVYNAFITVIFFFFFLLEKIKITSTFEVTTKLKNEHVQYSEVILKYRS